MSKSGTAGGTHGRRRTHPIWRRIALLLAVPLTALLGMWAIPATVTLSNALERFDFSTVYDNVGTPASAVTFALQEERAVAVRYLHSDRPADKQRFDAQVAKTDAAVAAFRKMALSPETEDAMSETMSARVHRLSGAYDELRSLRAQVGISGTTTLGAIDGYSKIADTTIRLLTTLASINDITVYQHTTALLHNFWARDFMLREDALLSTLRSGPMEADERAAFAAWAESRRQFFDLGRAEADGEIARIMHDLANSAAFTAYRTLEDSVVNNGLVPAAKEWRAAVKALSPVWLGAAGEAGAVVKNEDVEPAGRRIMLQFYLIGGVGLLSVVASVVLSLLFARRITAELRNLQLTAQRLAHERLPAVVARLRRGERVNVEAEAPPPDTGRTKEIALVGEAFDAVQRTAVGTAVGEAALRASINRVFINLSWRSQSLLHRQLRLLDQMERRAASPEELDDLFRLDHLTTRMRRHAEGLVILAGSPTVRSWDRPVPAEDVVRAAVAEIEDYTRVEMTGVSSVAVTGDVVADVIHLLAELIENAAVFSPPSTEVTVKVETVANGLAVEVVDRGIGLHPDELDELNTRLAGDAEFDLVDTERLGLFVVARLAARHGIRVSLQPSAYGGTTAVVLVPHALVTLDDDLAHGGPALGMTRSTAAETTVLAALPRLGRRSRPALPRVIAAAPEAGTPAPPSTPPGPSGPPAVFDDRTRPRGAEPETFEVEDSEITGRLPRRVRQRHLVPQLRRRPEPEPAAEPDEDFDEPNPELSRDLMASLQSGWLRGRYTDDETGEFGRHGADFDHDDEWGER